MAEGPSADMMHNKRFLIWRSTCFFCALMILSGCASGTATTTAAATITAVSAAAVAPTATLTPRPSDTAVLPTSTARPPAATATPAFAMCSPLEGITLAEMSGPDLLKNPFQAPRPGMDDGHHGADFAYWSRGDRKEMLGLPVLSTLSGRVAGVILNRPPYGNAVIIETRLDALPTAWQPVLPTPAPTVQPASSLFCPPDPTSYNSTGRSLYLLYAHMNKTPLVSVDQTVACGQPIGEVGTTGKSVNPHLHLETRVGPSGATFQQMAHYDNGATDVEMRTYCTWRVSGLFQMFDPVQLLSLQP